MKVDFNTLAKCVAENSKKRYKMVHKESLSRSGSNNDDGSTLSQPTTPAESVPSTTLPLLSSVSASTSSDPSVSVDPRVTPSSAISDVLPDMTKDPNPDPSNYYIRAVQGHSIQINESLYLDPITLQNLPSICVHGTYYTALTSIISSGHLSKMGRTHIHCAAGLPKASIHPETGVEIPAVLSGMRFNAEVLIFVDLKKCVEDGVGFWRSDNNVLLTNGKNGSGILELEYVSRVEDVAGRAGGGNLWTREDGVLKDWPKGGKGSGKGNKKLTEVSTVGGKSSAEVAEGVSANRGNGRGRGRGGNGRNPRPRIQVEDDLEDLQKAMTDTQI